MKLTVTQGILEKCILEENEKDVFLPETVIEIANNAFADSRPGQIRFLQLPESLMKVHPHSFRNAGHIKEVHAYSYGSDEQVLQSDEYDSEPDDLLSADKLVILKGKRGNTFILDQLFNHNPEEIELFADCRFREIFRTDFVYDQVLENVKTMRILGSDSYAPAFSADTLKHIAMPSDLKNLQFVNTVLAGQGYESNDRIFVQFFKKRFLTWRTLQLYINNNDYFFQWYPIEMDGAGFGISSMTKLEKLILPLGLTEINNDVIWCDSLRKAIVPSSVRSIRHSFLHCASLKSVSVDIEGDKDLIIDRESFSDCPKLKTVQICITNRISGNRAIVEKVNKDDWLRYHYLKDYLADFAEKYPDIASTEFYNADCMREQYQNCRQKKADLEAEYAGISECAGTVRSAADSDPAAAADRFKDQIEELNEKYGWQKDPDTLIESFRDYLKACDMVSWFAERYENTEKTDMNTVTDYDRFIVWSDLVRDRLRSTLQDDMKMLSDTERKDYEHFLGGILFLQRCVSFR